MAKVDLDKWLAVEILPDIEYDCLQPTQVNADKRGHDVLRPLENQVFIDIDDAESMARFHRAWPYISQEYPGTYAELPSPSGTKDRKHIIVTLDKPVNILTRIALGAILGTDAKHSACSLIRMKRGVGDEVVLYRPRPQKMQTAKAKRVLP